MSSILYIELKCDLKFTSLSNQERTIQIGMFGHITHETVCSRLFAGLVGFDLFASSK